MLTELMPPIFEMASTWLGAGIVLLTGLETLLIVALLVSRARQANRAALLRAEIAGHAEAEQMLKDGTGRELQRIAFDLHDGVCPFLTGIAFKAKLLQVNLTAESLPHVAETQQIVDLINDAVGHVRDLIGGLAPPVLEFRELLAALRVLAAETGELFNVDGSVTANRATLPVGGPCGGHLYRIAREATHNAIKHGGARQVDIDVVAKGSRLSMVIRDDGTGFAPSPVPGNGLGLRAMKYRAKLLGGTLVVASRPGKGTAVECVVPYAFPEEAANPRDFA